LGFLMAVPSIPTIGLHGEHMAGDVPGRSRKGQYGKREKYKGCN
jgi:hypothetical protein